MNFCTDQLQLSGINKEFRKKPVTTALPIINPLEERLVPPFLAQTWILLGAPFQIVSALQHIDIQDIIQMRLYAEIVFSN